MSGESKIPSPEQEAATRAMTIMLEAAVDRLPETYRSIFMLREVEGLSTADTAECLDLTEEAVKVRLHRARAMTRKHIYAQINAATVGTFQFMGVRCELLVSIVLDRIRSLYGNALTAGQCQSRSGQFCYGFATWCRSTNPNQSECSGSRCHEDRIYHQPRSR